MHVLPFSMFIPFDIWRITFELFDWKDKIKKKQLACDQEMGVGLIRHCFSLIQVDFRYSGIEDPNLNIRVRLAGIYIAQVRKKSL